MKRRIPKRTELPIVQPVAETTVNAAVTENPSLAETVDRAMLVSEVVPADRVPGAYERSFMIDGKEFTLDFALGYLAEAELACARQGRFINLLFALDPSSLNLHRLRNLFYGALQHYHGELTYETAIELLKPENVHEFANTCWTVFLPKATV